MNQKRSKSPSFDAIIKFFLMRHEIVTKKDLQKILDRLEAIESLLRASGGALPRKTVSRSKGEQSDNRSAYQRIYELFQEGDQGYKVTELREITGWNDKKVRNVVYRLLKAGKIQRTDRGRYGLVAS